MQAVSRAPDGKGPYRNQASAASCAGQIHCLMRKVAAYGVDAVGPGGFDVDHRGLPPAVGHVFEGGQWNADERLGILAIRRLGSHGHRSTPDQKLMPSGSSELSTVRV